MEVVCLFRTFHTRWFGVYEEGHNFNAFQTEMVMKWRGDRFGME
jgi:hypothetical protein